MQSVITVSVRGELFSLSLGCRDTLNIFWGLLSIFSEERICGPFYSCLDAGTMISF